MRMDVVKVNGLPFLVTYSRVLKFGTAMELVNTKMGSIVSDIALMFRVYGTRYFKVSVIAADNALQPYCKMRNS